MPELLCFSLAPAEAPCPPGPLSCWRPCAPFLVPALDPSPAWGYWVGSCRASEAMEVPWPCSRSAGNGPLPFAGLSRLERCPDLHGALLSTGLVPLGCAELSWLSEPRMRPQGPHRPVAADWGTWRARLTPWMTPRVLQASSCPWLVASQTSESDSLPAPLAAHSPGAQRVPLTPL